MNECADFGYDWGMGSTLEENAAQLKYLTNTSTIQGGQMVVDGVEKSVRVKSIAPYRVTMPRCPTGMSCIQVMPSVPEVRNLAIYDPAIHSKPNYVGYFLGEDASIDRLFIGESDRVVSGNLMDYIKPMQPVQGTAIHSKPNYVGYFIGEDASVPTRPVQGTALNLSQMILPSPSPLTTTSPLPTHSPTPSSVEEKKSNIPLIAGVGVLVYFLMS